MLIMHHKYPVRASVNKNKQKKLNCCILGAKKPPKNMIFALHRPLSITATS